MVDICIDITIWAQIKFPYLTHIFLLCKQKQQEDMLAYSDLSIPRFESIESVIL